MTFFTFGSKSDDDEDAPVRDVSVAGVGRAGDGHAGDVEKFEKNRLIVDCCFSPLFEAGPVCVATDAKEVDRVGVGNDGDVEKFEKNLVSADCCFSPLFEDEPVWGTSADCLSAADDADNGVAVEHGGDVGDDEKFEKNLLRADFLKRTTLFFIKIPC